jgi:hypothetical protein
MLDHPQPVVGRQEGHPVTAPCHSL